MSTTDGAAGGPPAAVHVKLAHACVQWIAESVDVRILHFKGQAVDEEMRAIRGGGSDVDVLVALNELARFESALQSAGWTLFTSFRSGSVFGHAATYYHPTWGTADVHRWIPGLDRDPRSSFELLWADRLTRELGGVVCAVPSDDHHRLILLFHAARNGVSRGADFQLGWGEVDASQRRRIRSGAYAMGGHVPFTLVTTGTAFVPGRHARLWAAVMNNRGTTEQWVARFKDASSLQDVSMLIRDALNANQDHLGLKLGHRPSRGELLSEQVRRVSTAARWVRGKIIPPSLKFNCWTR